MSDILIYQNDNGHIKAIFEDKELDEVTVVRNYRITASDGKNYDLAYSNELEEDIKRLK